jgi:hypothetical protein
VTNKFTFIHESYGTKITYETDDYTLNALLENFEDFLKGCGFVFDGNIDIVKDDYSDCCDDENTNSNSFEWTVNQIRRVSSSKDTEVEIEKKDLEKCPVCKIPVEKMKDEKCYGPGCPLNQSKVSETNAI